MADTSAMELDHERLHVYQHAISLLAVLDEVQGYVPAGRAHLRDQLERAATSIVLNIAEGAGEFSPTEKQRFYRMARRSAIEVAAILDILKLRLIDPQLLARARAKIIPVVAILVRLASK